MLKPKQAQSTIFLTYILFTFCCLSSCKKEDNTPPTISITSPLLNDTIRNEVLIKFDAEDNEGVSYVEVYANDSLLGKGNDSFTWNTLGVNDGPYKITCKVYDKNGNFKEDRRDIFVENALIKVISGPLMTTYNILITDTTGDILAKRSFDSNSIFYLKSSKVFEKETFNIYYHRIINNESYVIGYLNVKRGFVLDMDSKSSYSSTKSVQVHVKNATNFSKLQISTDSDYREFVSLADTSNLMRLNYTPDHGMFVQVEKSGGLYYKYYTIDGNSAVWIDIDEINTPMAKKNVALPPNSSYCSAIILGKTEPNEEQSYFLGMRSTQLFNQNNYELNYPSDGSLQELKCFISWNDYANINESYGNTYNKGLPDKFEPLRISCDLVNSQLPQFKGAFNSDLDYYILYYYNGTNQIQLSVSNKVKEFNLPDLETIFNDHGLKFSAFTLKQLTAVRVVEFPKEDFLNNYIISPNLVSEMFDIRYKYFSLNH